MKLANVRGAAADSPACSQPTARAAVWRWRFSGAYAGWALLIFLAEVAIATVGRDVPWLRWWAGDVIVVAWVHALVAMLVAAPVWRIATLSFCVACMVELSQYVCGVMDWQIQQPVLRIIVGSVADWGDVAAYAVGAMLVPLALRLRQGMGPRLGL